jgi:hypothetical protein
MATYHPKQRTINARVLTNAGWLSGSFVIPQTALFLEYFKRPADFDILTNVSSEDIIEPTPFFMLNRTYVTLLVVDGSEGNIFQTYSSETMVTKEIFCLLPVGILQGTIRILRNTRVSDFFFTRQGFIAVTDCLLRTSVRRQEEDHEERIPLILLNTQHVLGVSDSRA